MFLLDILFNISFDFSTDSRGGGGFAEIMQLPKWNIRNNNSYSSYNAKYDDLNKWKDSKDVSNP